MVSEVGADIEKPGAGSEKESQRWLNSKDLLERCLGNAQLANRVLTRFQGGLDETVRQLELLAAQEDWSQLAKRAHRLKGEAGNIGCLPLAELASNVEEACGRGDAARPVVEELARACRAFQREVVTLTEGTERTTDKSSLLARFNRN